MFSVSPRSSFYLPSAHSASPKFGKILQTYIVTDGAASKREDTIKLLDKLITASHTALDVKKTRIQSTEKSVKKDIIIYHDQHTEPGIQDIRSRLGEPDSLEALTKREFNNAYHIVKDTLAPIECKIPKSTFQTVKEGTFEVITALLDTMLYGMSFGASAS